MAKKIRFPLEMDNGIEVRSLEELRDNFSLARILEYRKNGKLMIWLRDRYANDIADAIDALDEIEEDIAKSICEIFGVTYDEETELALEKAAERTERINRLMQYTDDEKFVVKIDSIAFDQDELYDLLDENVETIYLCGERFSIPLAKKGISYIGVNNPVLVIDSKVEVDWSEKQISIEDVKFDEKYQAVIDSANATKEKLYEKLVEVVQKKATNFTQIGDYSEKTYLNFMIAPIDKAAVKRLYEKSKGTIEKLKYDPDDDVLRKKELVQGNHIIGLADGYINNL